jgi:hypothetical protein
MNTDSFIADCETARIPIEIGLAIRSAVAKVAGVEPIAIVFDTPTHDILKWTGRSRLDGWDDAAFLFAFEEVIGTQINFDDLQLPRIAPSRFFIWKYPGAKRFGEWCSQVAPLLACAMTQKQGTANV